MLQDVRYAVRVILKERGFAAAAVVALALGIGVNATGFTLVNGVLLRERAFSDNQQVFVLSWLGERGRRVPLSHPDFEEVRAGARSFARLAALIDETVNISDDRGLPAQAYGARVTAGAFDVFDQQPLAGRGFTPDDERTGAPPVAIIAHRLWEARYGADPGALGATLRVNGIPATIVGIMPPGIRFPGNAEVWTPLVTSGPAQSRNARALLVFARVARGVSRRTAEAETTAVAHRTIATHPDDTKGLVGMVLESVPDRFIGPQPRIMFLALMGAVSFVLLIACANVANLQLARSISRTREIAVRMALGASRRRVARLLLIESVLLGIAGGALGLVFAYVGVRLFDAAVLDASRPYWIVFTLDRAVFAYAAGVAVLTAILAGLAPAMHLSRRNSQEGLTEEGRGNIGGSRTRWFSSALVIVQLALTLVLLTGAGLMVRSYYNLRSVDNGYASEHVMTMRLQLPRAKYPNADTRRVFYEQLDTRLNASRGIAAAAVTTAVPPTNNEEWRLGIEGRTPETKPIVSVVRIGPRFFDVLDRTLVLGRSLAPADAAAGSPGVIINQRLARQLFPTDDPLGRRVRLVQRNTDHSAAPGPWRTIVGISPDIRHSAPEDAETDPVVYVPLLFEPPGAARLMVRSQLPADSLYREIRRAVQAIDPDQPIYSFQTIEEFVRERQWPYSAFGGAFAVFAVIALVLSAVGLYAVVAYSVTQRTAEIGVRMALGARVGHIMWLILRRGLAQVLLGVLIGLAGAFVLSGVLQSLLVQVGAGDPLTFGGVTLILTIVALAACLLPTRRAATIDPIAALSDRR